MEKNEDILKENRYILDIKTGICHDLDNFDLNCKIEHIKAENIFSSNHLYDEIKRHPSYKKKCKYCMYPNI